MTGNDIRKRIFSVIESGSVHMNALLRLIDIRVTDDDTYVCSAAITCSSTPEIIINKNFVQKYCETDEYLFMLVMHELYHMILGHTTFFNRNSIIDNIAFDAVINAMLCRSFPYEKFVSFFKKMNSSASFPSCLLRPFDKDTPVEFKKILDVLYKSDNGTFYEVFELLKKTLKSLTLRT